MSLGALTLVSAGSSSPIGPGPHATKPAKAKPLTSSARTHTVGPSDSVEAAVAAAAPGDTILLHAGSYPTLTLTRQFAGEPLRIAGAPGESVVVGGFAISGSGYRIESLATNGQTMVRGQSHDVTFDRLRCTLPASGTFAPDGSTPPSCFFFADAASNLKVANSTIRGGWDGVKIYSRNSVGAGWVRDVAIVNNDIAGAYEDNIHIDGGDGVNVQHNVIHDPLSTGLHNDGIQSQASNRLRIVQNTFSFTTVAAGGYVGTAIMLGNTPAQFPDRKVVDTAVRNNLVAHWQPGRALIMNGTDGVQIVNNTMLDNGNAAINDPSITIANQGEVGGQNRDVEIWNNILKSVYFASGSDPPDFFSTNILTQPYSGMSGSDVTHVNPRFFDRARYAPIPNSRARRLGLSRPGTPVVDIDGKRRARPPGLGARS